MLRLAGIYSVAGTRTCEIANVDVVPGDFSYARWWVGCGGGSLRAEGDVVLWGRVGEEASFGGGSVGVVISLIVD